MILFIEQPLQILLVEDDEDDAFLIKDLMQEIAITPQPQVHFVTTGDDALELLKSQTIDLCIFDFRLGIQTGIDLLDQVRDAGCEAPVIFLTGQGDQETAVQAMKSGATDYMTKNNLSAETLFHSIRHATNLKKEEDLRKRAEAELRKSHDDLTQANEKLKKSLDKLQSAQDQIVRSEKLASVGRLAAGVCHEILNPLNIISGHVQALSLERENDKPLMEDFESVMEEIQRIEKIIGGLLKFSRKDEMVIKPANINEELDSVLSLTEKDMLINGIKVVRDYSVESLNIKFDANRMRQVFLNLINNARHAMEKGGTLTVSTSITLEKNEGGKRIKVPVDPASPNLTGGIPYLQIRFADTGTGIRKENLNKLFEPFFTTKPEDQGTGLGLSICYSIIEKHLGNLEVESEFGQGSTFIIELPINTSLESTPLQLSKGQG